MNATLVGTPGRISTEARIRMASERGEPFLIADWLNVLMIHYCVDAGVLQDVVPFELDLLDGHAFVSLVAFDMVGMRLRMAGRLGGWLLRPIASHPFLNVRTYVRCNGEAGIYFLAEWLPNRLSVMLGPRAFGLPYRRGRIEPHQRSGGRWTVSVKDCGGDGGLFCRTNALASQASGVCEPGSRDEWLMERYTAFTSIGERRRFFHVWHPPWEQQQADVEVCECSLLTSNWPMLRNARYIGANVSQGVRRVWMGRPRRIELKT